MAVKPMPMNQQGNGAVNAAYQALLGRPAATGDVDYWSQQLASGTTPFAMETSLRGSPEGQINYAYNNLLGRDVQPEALKYLMPAMTAEGPQTVRQRLAGSEEYQNRMFGPSSSPWQTAARQGTMNQSMMPGSFWDYSNPLLADPSSAQALLHPSGAGTSIMQALLDPNSGWLKELLGLGKEDEKKSTGGRPDDRSATPVEESTFMDRIRRTG